MFSLSLPHQFLLLLGCFALFWSLYYTLEVTLARMDPRAFWCLPRRRSGPRTWRWRRGRGVEEAMVGEEAEEYREEEEQDSGVELQTVLDSEAKAPLIIGERLAT